MEWRRRHSILSYRPLSSKTAAPTGGKVNVGPTGLPQRSLYALSLGNETVVPAPGGEASSTPSCVLISTSALLYCLLHTPPAVELPCSSCISLVALPTSA